MPALDPVAALPAAADVDVELAVQGPAGDFGLVLVGDFRLDQAATAAGSSVGERRFVALLDLVGRGRRPTAVGTVSVAALAAGGFGVGLGFAAAEGGGLTFAGAADFVEQAGEFLDLPL